VGEDNGQRMKRRLFPVALGAIVLLAAMFRFSHISERPMHGDEANQAVKAGTLFDKGVYRYDPHEHHGPVMYYAALIPLWLGGAASFADSVEWEYRVVPAFFGVALVGLFGFLGRGLGRAAALWGALFTAISHAMVYYSRYFIQEMILVFFLFAAILAGYWLLRCRRVSAALLFGALLGMSHATKETWLLAFGAALLAAGGTLLWWWGHRGGEPRPQRPPWKLLALSLVTALVVSVTLYSSFFTHARGPLDSLLTYTGYAARAGGEGSTASHHHPWYYYFSLLLYTYREAGPRWSEAPMPLLALIGALDLLLPRKNRWGDVHLQRFLLLYTVLLTLLFSVLPYKTPWNLLPFYQGMLILAGIGAAALLRCMRRRSLQLFAVAALVAVSVHAARQSRDGISIYAADVRNPYVYAHTSTALLKLAKRVDGLAAVHPDGKAMRIDIRKPDGDYWPLPWYLRQYTQVSWSQAPPQFNAPLIITEMRMGRKLDEELSGSYQVETSSLRPGILLLAFIQQDLWDNYMANRAARTE
jgi:uncharacterized protein (TIGR03663 family)